MSFQKHIDAIASGEVTKTNIIGLRKAMNATVFPHLYCKRLAASSDLIEQVYLALAMIDRDNPKVVGDLHDSGVKTLQNKRYAKRLAEYQDVIEWPSHFELCGFDKIGAYGQYVVPIYRLTGQNGGTFKFMNIPWQSGGNGPEIVY
jgi:hypothetical protein